VTVYLHETPKLKVCGKALERRMLPDIRPIAAQF